MYNHIDSNKRKTKILMIVFTLFVVAVGWFLNEYMGYGYGAVVIAVVLSLGMTLTSYYHGDKVALKSSGAREIKKEDNPYIWRMVENLTITAGMPMPRVHIIDSPALNAFATGRDPKHASIAFTTGIIKALENEELEGVVAHELSHVQNYDIRVMTIVVVLVGTLSLLADFFVRARFYGAGRRDSGGGKASGALAIIGLVLLLISPIVANLIKLAISRKREFLADASGSMLTRYPEGLARALEKISQSKQPLQSANAATAHLFISNPFKKHSISGLFSTHPPIEERVKRLRGN